MTDWTLVAAVLGAGLLLGGLLLLLLGRRSAPATEAAPPTSLGDLYAERDLLLERLRALEFDEGDPEAVAAERRALELRAARVLRAVERAERPAPAAPVPAAPASSALRGFAWGLGTAAFLGLLVALALHFSKDRSPPAPSMAGAAMALDADPELVGLIARVESEPESVEARLDLIQGLLARERYVDAWPFIQALAATHPDHPRRLLYEATVREAMGHWEIARDLLDRALEGDASLTEAWVRRGLVSFELGDWAAALESWETALRQRPDGRQVLEPVIAEARRRLEEGAPPPARQPAPTRAPSAEAAGESLHIRIDLAADARARIGEGGVLFVTARPAGVRAGPPAAVKRIFAASFPVELRLGPADTMMGQPFPTSAYVEARLDRDGDASTQQADDPRASADDVRVGSTLQLVLE